ncbi:MAG: hypothetical protein ABFC62_07010 [Clostridiaceae bacterium]
MKSFKRIAAAAMALMLLTSLGSFAWAEEADSNNVQVIGKQSYSADINGTVNVGLTVNYTAGGEWLEDADFSITSVKVVKRDSIYVESISGDAVAPEYNERVTIKNGAPYSINVPLEVNSASASGTVQLRLELVFYKSAGDLVGTPYTEYVVLDKTVDGSKAANAANLKIVLPSTTPTPTPTPDNPAPNEPISGFRLSPVDAGGNRVAAPSGNYGQQVTVRIPLAVKAPISNITIVPVLTTSLDTFPFVISEVDYTMTYPGAVGAGQIVEFQYTFTLSKLVTAGVKQIDFMVTGTEPLGGNWSNKTVAQGYSDKISIFLTVGKGAPVPNTNPDTPAAVSTPKLIVDSYSFSTDKVYAGETFDVTFVLRNTSETEVIQNLQIHIADGTSTVLPANSGSNTLYVAKIGKGETHTETISLQSTPGAEAKAYTLEVDMEYEAASTKTAYKATETISVPVLQKIRVKADDPIIYDEAWVGSPFSMYLPFYNLGKSTVYNCTISVEGDGLAMQEGFFGGNVASGGSMNADFTVVPSTAGEINANVVVSYEDVYGEAYELKIPFTVFVNEMSGEPSDGMGDGGGMPLPGDGGMVDGGVAGPQAGLPLWEWIAIGAAAAAAVIVLIVILKRRRSKESEEL